MAQWFGSSWSTIGWVVASTAAMYATTVAAVRLAGRRTVTQISAFDVVVTIALGSIVATTAVSPSASYAQGAAGVITLLALQVVVAALRMRFPALGRYLDFRPRIVLEAGEPRLPGSPLGPQLTAEELASLLRQQGHFDPGRLAIVVMEPTGSLSVSEAPQDLDLHG